MTSNAMHARRCLASAIIACVENFRDAEGMTDFDFRISAQDNKFLAEADQFLSDGIATCTCGERKLEQIFDLFTRDPNSAQMDANEALTRGEISPEQYLRLARHTRSWYADQKAEAE